MDRRRSAKTAEMMGNPARLPRPTRRVYLPKPSSSEESFSETACYASGDTSFGENFWSTTAEDTDTDSEDAADPIIVWVIDKPFEFGTLPIYPSDQISVPILVKVLGYCRRKGWLDTLPLAAWYHICKCKLRLSYHVGWTYIRLYNILFQQMDRIEGDSNENGEWDTRCNKLKSKKYDHRDEFKVPTMKFVLFLFLQHAYRLMCKYGPNMPLLQDTASSLLRQLLAERDSESSDDEFDVAGIEREEKKIIDEQLQLKFVSRHIAFMLNILESYDPDRGSPRLKLEIVDTFDLILSVARSSKLQETIPLKEVLMKWGIAGYDRLSHSVDRQLFIRWIKRSLRLNPWGVNYGFLKKPISPLVTGIIDDECDIHIRRENRIMRNYNNSPSGWYTIRGVTNQVLMLDDIQIHADILVSKCQSSFIYLCGSFSCVAIEWCRNCTIYLGCVAGVLRLTGCKGIRLTGLARQIIMNETVLSTFQVHTACDPIIAGIGSSQLFFGPYTSCYPRLRMDMWLTKMSPVVSQWDSVRGITYNGLHCTAEHQWSRLEGKALREYLFPFKMCGSTKISPIVLQARHSWVLRKKKRSMEKWTQSDTLIDVFGLKQEDIPLFKAILFRRFIKFMLDRKFHQEIQALVSYNEEARQGRPAPPSPSFEGQPQSLQDVVEILLDLAEDRKQACQRTVEYYSSCPTSSYYDSY